jgi:hypothetical protein
MGELHKSECINSKGSRVTLLEDLKGRHLLLANWQGLHSEGQLEEARTDTRPRLLSLSTMENARCPSRRCHTRRSAVSFWALLVDLERKIG